MALLPLLSAWKRRLESCGVEVLPNFEKGWLERANREGPERLIGEALLGFARDLRLAREGECVTGLPGVDETLAGLDLSAVCWLAHRGLLGKPPQPPSEPPPKTKRWSVDSLPFLGKPGGPPPSPDPGGPASAWPAERIAASGTVH